MVMNGISCSLSLNTNINGNEWNFFIYKWDQMIFNESKEEQTIFTVHGQAQMIFTIHKLESA